MDGSATDPLTVYKIEVFGSDWPRRELYVDGTLVASLAVRAYVPITTSLSGRGRSSGSYDYYRGYLVQVQFYDYGVKNITNLLRDAPVFRLRLDEQSQPTTNQFSSSVAGLPDAANSPVSCATTEWCPVAGPPGKMNRSAPSSPPAASTPPWPRDRRRIHHFLLDQRGARGVSQW